MDIKDRSLEELLFQIIDACKGLFFPEQWNRTFMDYSKNEVFTLFLVYRKGQVNMTEIADYLVVPLNTVTGIVSRLEKREVVTRERDKDDKRIVVVNMRPTGKEFVKKQIKEMEHYFELIMSNFTKEEMELAIKIGSKVFDIFKNNNSPNNHDYSNVKKVRRIPIE